MSRPDDLRDASAVATYYLDCERMRHPLTGVYEFCRRLGTAISRRLESGERIVRYGPELPEGTFPESVGTLRQHSYHKFTRIRPKDATLWHGCYQRTQYLPSRKIPFVLTIHDLNFLHEGKSSNSLRRNIQRVQKNVDRAAALVAISEFVAGDIRHYLRLEESRLHVVHNGCERIDLADRTRPASVPERDFVFALGPTNAKKNFHVLPALLLGNDFELVIAGFSEEPYAGRILNHAAALGVSDRVRIVGPVSESEKAWYYANCSAFAFPSLAEGFGLPVVEAMLFGKRVFLLLAVTG
ncbi:MAG TPA: glycosyltransferase, partial [Candidatus Ozemobacteraceae bacterium]|nr:glycosyltransferase [Candidatus Ozemobacteraceae bacterium]